MAAPTIPNGEEHFFPVIYSGNGQGQRVGKFVPFTDNGTIAKSCMFNDDDSPYLTRTQDSGTGDQKRKATFSWWFKRGSSFGTEMIHIAAAASSRLLVRFDTSNRMVFRLTNGTTEYQKVTNRTFEDTSKWYHCHWQIDASQSTATDRSKVWIDGDQITSWSSDSNPGQNTDVVGLSDGTTQRVSGTSHSTGQYFDGYLAEFNYCDGVITTVDNFGITDTSTGRWIPKALTGITYGSNGFRLQFGTSSALGDDTSGNTNDFSSSGLVASDQTTDSPTQNFPTVSVEGPYIGSKQATAEGGLKIVMTAGSGYPVVRPLKEIPQSGKWYWEVKAEQVGNIVGIQNACYGVLDLNLKDVNGLDVDKPFTRQIGGMGLEMSAGAIFTGLLTSAGKTATDFTIGSTNMGDDDYIVFAFDMDNGKAWWGWNDSSAGSSVVWFANDGGTDGNPSTGANPTVTFKPSNHRFVPAQGGFAPGSSDGAGSTYASNFIYNFGSKSFAFTAPTGFGKLSQENFPETAKGMSDFVWVKNRDQGSNSHGLTDSSRGASKVSFSNSTDAEQTYVKGLTKFLKGGYSCGEFQYINGSGDSLVSWNWVANSGTTSSNGDGNVTCTLQVNDTAKFSIQTWTNTGAGTKTIGHGLGVKPGLIIQKRLDTTSNWFTYHHSLTGNGSYLHLNTTDTTQTGSDFANTEPTSSVFSSNASGSSSATFVSYCFAEVDGYSKFGKYTANNSTDGPFVYTGFKPAFVMVKNIDSAYSWFMFDNKRDTFNPVSHFLAADQTTVYSSQTVMDFLSNGFKIRIGNASGANHLTNSHIYMAFAEHPFVGDGTSPVTAR